jgi:ancient ubiquitous protein 1
MRNTQEKLMVPPVPIEKLFDINRFTTKLSIANILLLVMYIPLGILIVVIRICLLFIWGIIFLMMPSTKQFKQIFCKGAAAIIGILYKFNNEYHISSLATPPRFVVSNHSYTFEFIAFITRYWCLLTARKSVLDHWLLARTAILVDIVVVNNLKSQYTDVAKTPYPIFVFPEGATTNGRVGLLKYNPLIFSYGESILPIATKISRPLPIAFCTLHFSLITDFLWLLYSPWTLFEYTILPVQKILPGESPEEFAKRVQVITADTLRLIATDFTAEDKKKLREIDLNK